MTSLEQQEQFTKLQERRASVTRSSLLAMLGSCTFAGIGFGGALVTVTEESYGVITSAISTGSFTLAVGLGLISRHSSGQANALLAVEQQALLDDPSLDKQA